MLIKHVAWVTSTDTEFFKAIKGNLEITPQFLIFHPKIAQLDKDSFQILNTEIKEIKLSRFYYKSYDEKNSIKNIPGVEIGLRNPLSSRNSITEIKLISQGNWIQRIFPKSPDDFANFTRTKYLYHLLRKELGYKLNTEDSEELQNYAEFDISPQKLQEFRELLQKNNRIRLDMIQSYLGLEKSDFDRLIFLWTEKYHFKLDGDYLISEETEIQHFLSKLDESFENWEKENRKKQ